MTLLDSLAFDVETTALADSLQDAVDHDDGATVRELATAAPTSRRDRFATLLCIYRLLTGPVAELGRSARFASDASVIAIKQRCESDWLAELEALPLPDGITADDAGAAMRALAARDRLPQIYRWIAKDADWNAIVGFLALEGGPDAGFDDLVATCQVGLTGSAKMELATNYWDEMGNGDPGAVHTTLHDMLAEAIAMPRLPLHTQPTSALERAALGGLLTTNRWLQPEALGALGLIELQAGPRCRLVLQGFERCGAPRAAYPFYEIHADVDPRHGRDWLDNAVGPIATEHPDWTPRMIRGAHWRSAVNARFLEDATQLLCPS